MTWTTILRLILPVLAGQLPPVPGDKSDAPGPRPQLHVAQRSVDLGTIIEGDKVTVTWLLENRGNADLMIDQTVPSCGCTVVQLAESEKVIAPGKSLTLKAEFDSTNRRDSQAKVVSVYSNDRADPKLQLDFKAKVDLLFETEPAGMLNLRTIRRGAQGMKALDIFPGPGRNSLTLHGIELEDDAPLSFQNEPIEVRGRAGRRILFTVHESASLGPLNAIAKLRLSVDGVDRERSYPIRGEIVADMTWLPKVIDATRQTSLPGKRLAPVVLSSTEKTPFDIVSASAGPLFDVTIEPSKTQPRTEYTVALTLRNDARSGPFGTTLDIRTTSLDQPQVSVPVFGIVAASLEIDPPVVMLRNDGTPSGIRRRIKVQAATSVDLEITDVACDLPAIKAEVNHKESSRYRHIRFLVVELSGKLPAGTHQATLRMATNVAGSERLEIPVTVEVASAKP